MAHLLLELFSEEIPARMQAKAEADLGKMLMDRLVAAGFLPQALTTASTPRRLVAAVEGLPERQPDTREERKGPRVGSPEGALLGFLRGAGLSSLDQAQIQNDPKGDFYLAVIEKPGRPTTDILAEIVPDIVRKFDWPKSMRSADQDFTWVRPLQAIVCCFDGQPVGLEVGGIKAGATTFGHRFHAPAPIKVRRYEDYAAALQKARVMLTRAERKDTILADARTLCAAQNLELVEDPGLLEEVCGLVEWPVVLMGDMDPAFLSLPAEVIRLTMRSHQKYFAVRDPKTGGLAPKFITVANIEANDGGKAIIAGNRRVLSARLNDAQFFWALDRKVPLSTDERRDKLRGLVFHAKLGSVWDKVERVAVLARELAPLCGADPEAAEKAARLSKMDLVTETVGEFPELQGQIGRQLFELEGGDQAIATAIEDHYRPLGPSDRVPTDPVAVALALADKLDTLTGFWAIDEKPTGSSDAYGLRRAALGMVRIVLERGVRLPLGRERVPPDLLTFLLDRLKVQLREQGKRHDLCDAVFKLGDDDLVRIVARIDALSLFLATPDGADLLAGYKRAANILAAEAKKGRAVDKAAALNPDRFEQPAERALADALAAVSGPVATALEGEDFAGAMKPLAGLRGPVDAFFDQVLVNAEDPVVRQNRLLLLEKFTGALGTIADFGQITG